MRLPRAEGRVADRDGFRNVLLGQLSATTGSSLRSAAATEAVAEVVWMVVVDMRDGARRLLPIENERCRFAVLGFAARKHAGSDRCLALAVCGGCGRRLSGAGRRFARGVPPPRFRRGWRGARMESCSASFWGLGNRHEWLHFGDGRRGVGLPLF